MKNEIPALLLKLTAALAGFLTNVLPRLDENWWEQSVVNVLSDYQRQRIERQNITSLSALDFAALLRVFNNKWYVISMELNLIREDRHYVKEMQSIRNRWAHSNANGFSFDDQYRDMDTLQRFAVVINADEALIQEIQAAKKNMLAPENPFLSPSKSILPQSSQNTDAEGQTEYNPGQMVALKSNPDIKGAVVSVLPGRPENRYQVFVNSGIQIYYASQLAACDLSGRKPELFSLDRFHAYLTALQIRYPGLSNLYSLNAARIDFVPYQFRPVLKFIRSERPRLLIADSVGVGKTIEAGLILRELQARRDIRSVLIICPRPLVVENKWRNEMKRFEERFEHLNGPNLRYCIDEMDKDGEWPERFRKAIIPYSLFDESLLHGKIKRPGGKRRVRAKKGLLDLDPPPKFDLVIVDEAHHIRNTDTARHKVVRFFCENAEAVVFLTATPIQLGDHDLFVLLNTLRPDLIIDQESFRNMSEPNPFINRAVTLARTSEAGWESEAALSLDKAAGTSWGRIFLCNNPKFIQTQRWLAKGNIAPEDRVQMITDMESLHTFSDIINRTRRRDIGDFTVRKPETVPVPFTAAQQELHDAVIAVQAEIFTTIHADIPVGFIMTTIRRQAASCLFGLVPCLNDILNRHMDELAFAEADIDLVLLGSDATKPISSRIQIILEKASSLDPVDPKLDALRAIIRDKQNLPNNKIMVFSTFRHTLGYLYKHLQADGLRVGMVHGNIPDEERAVIRECFAADRDRADALDILLFSEIGCEGLDYQFCDCIVNYDLPWNPMRIEQRIGRIDRKGQKSEAVAIYNLITPGTVDADIYERCMCRIGVFEHSLGGGEEILGEISTEIKNIADNLSLSEQERREKLGQLSDNKIRDIQEQERLEEQAAELFGIRLSRDRINQDIKNASSFWLTPGSLFRLVNLYLRSKAGKDQDCILGEKLLKTLRLSEGIRQKLLEDFRKLPRKTTPAHRKWENWLKGDAPHLSITFESRCASDNPDAAFIMPVHPLVKQAAFSIDKEKNAITVLRARDNDVPAGRHLFVMYQWMFYGIREDSIFIYEILQNADDYGASMVSFILDDDQLIIEHNGTPFIEENVRAISYFGKSTSRDDLVKTGRFGLGFKSVFAFTASPVIYSGEENFQIYDLYRLRASEKPADIAPTTTRIILPFNHVEIKPDYVETHVGKEKAFEKISSRLQKLDLTTLLFTRNILEIKWVVNHKEDTVQGHYRRQDSEKKRLTDIDGFRKTEITDGKDRHVYLVYSRSISWEGKKYKPVDIAFYLDSTGENEIIKPLKKPLFVLFPTTVETFMDFIMNGPFRTPAHRETVAQADDFNQFLIQEIGSLLCKSMVDIKGKGLLTVSFLELLPIEKENFSEDGMFYPIYKSVRDILKDEKLLPTFDGTYDSAAAAKLARGADLRDLINAEQLKILLASKDEIKWLPGEITHDRTPNLRKYLKEELSIEEITAESFIQKLSLNFLSAQSDKWIIEFYKFLGGHKPERLPRSDSILREKEIIRLENGSHVKPFGEDGKPNAYLPSSDGTNFPTVKRNIASDKDALDFLKRLGIIGIDLFAELSEFVLPKYSEEAVFIDLSTNIEDLRKVASAYELPQQSDNKNNLNLLKIFLNKRGWQGLFDTSLKQSKFSESIKPSFLLKLWLQPIKLIQAVNNHTREIKYKCMDDIYLKNQVLAMYFENNENCWFVNDEYPEDALSLFKEFEVAESPKIQKRNSDRDGYVQISSGRGNHKRGLNKFDPDFKVDGLDHAIQYLTLNKSRYIWNTIAIANFSQVSGSIESSSKKTYEGSKKKKVFSRFGRLLTDYSWLPDKSGVYHKPIELGLDDLPDGFEKNTSAAKELSLALSMEQPANERYLEILSGGDVERKKLLEKIIFATDSELAKIKKIFPSEVLPKPAPLFREGLKNLDRKQRGAIEDEYYEHSPANDTERYQGKLNDNVEKSVKDHRSRPQKISFSQIRKISSNQDARIFLYNQYKGRCQVSGTTFPKAARNANGNASYYFTACSLLSYTNTEYLNDAGNMLCVSSDTMAKFKFASVEFLDSIEDAIVSFKSNEEKNEKVSVRIRLAGEDCSITWNQRHFMRLVALFDKA